MVSQLQTHTNQTKKKYNNSAAQYKQRLSDLEKCIFLKWSDHKKKFIEHEKNNKITRKNEQHLYSNTQAEDERTS